MNRTKMSLLTKRASGSTKNLDHTFGISLDDGEIHVMCDCDPNGEYIPTALLMEYLSGYQFDEESISSESLSKILYDINENLISLQGITVCTSSITLLYMNDDHICGASCGGNKILYKYRERYGENDYGLFHFDLTYGAYSNGRVGAKEEDLKSPCIVSQFEHSRDEFDTIILQSGGASKYFTQDEILDLSEKTDPFSDNYTENLCNSIIDTIESKYQNNIAEDVTMVIFHKPSELEIVEPDDLSEL